MARGHPDFGATAPRELTTPQLDSGELAARLGSPDVYDRLGTVLAVHIADQPVGPIEELTPGSGRRDSFLANSPFSPYVWRLTTTNIGEQPGVLFLIPYIGDSPVGVEVVHRQAAAGSTNPTLEITVGTGAVHTRGGVRWEDGLGRWQYRDDAGTWTDTPTQPSALVASRWHTLKFVIDPVAQTYGRALFNGETMALAGIDADDIPVAARTLQTSFSAAANGAATVSIDVAAVIVTVNEL